jgi:hypothetical protein
MPEGRGVIGLKVVLLPPQSRTIAASRRDVHVEVDVSMITMRRLMITTITRSTAMRTLSRRPVAKKIGRKLRS